MPFAQLGLHPDLVRAVKAMNFTKPTPIQEMAVPSALEGRDVLGCAQTGGGKTAAFGLPLLHHLLQDTKKSGIRALILTPTRELAAQVESTFREIGKFCPFKTAVIIGGVGFTPQVHAAARAQIVVATPGRLLDHLQRGSFRIDRVEQLVLDEADRMLDMGFLPDIKSIIAQLPKERQTQLYSATLAPEVERIAAFTLKNPKRIEITRPTTVAEGISQILYPVVQSQKPGLLIHLLKTTEMKSVLVFSRTKHGADKLAKKLQAAGFTAGVLHGNRSQNQRTQAMDGFRRGQIKMLVATDIAARGIDVKGISHVVNYDVPRFPEDYVHRVGRTARAYGVGDAITFMDPSQEKGCIRDIERFVGITFPRATLPGFQYNAPPDEEFEDRRPPQRGNRFGGGQGRGGPQGNSQRRPNPNYAPRRDDRGGNGPRRDDHRGGNAPRRDDRGGSTARGDNRGNSFPRRDGNVNPTGRPGRVGFAFRKFDKSRNPNQRDGNRFGANEPRREGRRDGQPPRRDGAPQPPRDFNERYRPSGQPQTHNRHKGYF